MFANAIDLVGNFTRPVKIITRNYKDTTIMPGAATIFFVNDDGCAITCKHVAEELICADSINQNYINFKNECAQLPNDNKRRSAIKKLEQKYNLSSSHVVQMKVQFPDCVGAFSEIDIQLHPNYDLAILKFKGHSNRYYTGHAVFAKNGNDIRPGDFLCRLGYPFPEFEDFIFDSVNDDIDWDASKVYATPRFPIDGMFTRHLADATGKIYGVEMSTPGLRGQSGGPLFTSDGVIYGIQSMTNHLHLGFDMVKEKMTIGGRQTTINNQPFLHVGQCVHVDIIKEFLDTHKITYYIGTDPSNEIKVN